MGVGVYVVRVDDPDMKSPHEFRVVALNEYTARLGAARRAILADENGLGQGYWPAADAGRASWWTRVRQARASAVVAVIAECYAVAVRQS